MPGQTALPHGVMEGKGAYNRYAKLPAGGAALALPLLEVAVPQLLFVHPHFDSHNQLYDGIRRKKETADKACRRCCQRAACKGIMD